jgi:hypothetical protein
MIAKRARAALASNRNLNGGSFVRTNRTTCCFGGGVP